MCDGFTLIIPDLHYSSEFLWWWCNCHKKCYKCLYKSNMGHLFVSVKMLRASGEITQYMPNCRLEIILYDSGSDQLRELVHTHIIYVLKR